MPIITKGKSETNIHYALWKIEESEEQLSEILGTNKEQESDSNSIRIQQRRIESLAARCALFELLQPYGDFDFHKDEFGKPHLKNSQVGLSISHTRGYAAAAINLTGPIGIDIEKQRGQILKIQRKFLHESEKEWAQDHIDRLTQIWSAKESLYKLHGRTQLIFAEQLITYHQENCLTEGSIIENGIESRFQIFTAKNIPLTLTVAY